MNQRIPIKKPIKTCLSHDLPQNARVQAYGQRIAFVLLIILLTGCPTPPKQQPKLTPLPGVNPPTMLQVAEPPPPVKEEPPEEFVAKTPPPQIALVHVP